jgi:hypothetical protein
LLAKAQQHFDVFVTIDRKLENQHELNKIRLGFVVARVPSNRISSYRPIFAVLLAAAENVRRGEVRHVVSPEMRDLK